MPSSNQGSMRPIMLRYAPLPHQLIIPPSATQLAFHLQAFYPLDDPTLTWWESQLVPRVLPPSASIVPTHQPSQRSDALPDFNQQWWEAFDLQVKLLPPSASPVAPNIVPSERHDPLPSYDFSWWEAAIRHVLPPSASIVPSHQPSQRFDDLPDLWAAGVPWQTFPKKISSVVIVAAYQWPVHSQRFDPLPEFDLSWYTAKPLLRLQTGTVAFTNFWSGKADEWGKIQDNGTIITLSDGIPAARANAVGTGKASFKFGSLGTAGTIFGPPNLSLPVTYHRFYFKWEIKPTTGHELFFLVADIASAEKFRLHLNSAGNIEVYDAFNPFGSKIATSSTALAKSTWYRIELQVGTGNPAFWEVKIFSGDDVAPLEILNGSHNLGTGSTFQCVIGKEYDLGGNTVDFYFRHFFWSGSSYPGPGHCVPLSASADGFYVNGLANGAVQRWQAVDDIAPDEDVTYVNGLAQNQAYTARTIGGIAGKINAVKSYARGRSDDGITGITYNARLRSAGVDVDTLATGVGNPTYISRQRVFDLDPATGLAWTEAGVNAAEVGFVQNTAAPVRVTSIDLMVDYLPATSAVDKGASGICLPSDYLHEDNLRSAKRRRDEDDLLALLAVMWNYR